MIFILLLSIIIHFIVIDAIIEPTHGIQLDIDSLEKELVRDMKTSDEKFSSGDTIYTEKDAIKHHDEINSMQEEKQTKALRRFQRISRAMLQGGDALSGLVKSGDIQPAGDISSVVNGDILEAELKAHLLGHKLNDVDINLPEIISREDNENNIKKLMKTNSTKSNTGSRFIELSNLKETAEKETVLENNFPPGYGKIQLFIEKLKRFEPVGLGEIEKAFFLLKGIHRRNQVIKLDEENDAANETLKGLIIEANVINNKILTKREHIVSIAKEEEEMRLTENINIERQKIQKLIVIIEKYIEKCKKKMLRNASTNDNSKERIITFFNEVDLCLSADFESEDGKNVSKCFTDVSNALQKKLI